MTEIINERTKEHTEKTESEGHQLILQDEAAGCLSRQSLSRSAVQDACQVVKDAAGKGREIPLEHLGAGDHTIKLNGGRQFVVHVPDSDGSTQLPVVFMFSGSAHGQYDIKDFVAESGMNRYADSPQNQFITVYPLPVKHLLGTGSDKAAYGWNVLDQEGGVLIDKADSRQAGYDDLDFVNKIVKILPQVTNVDSTHRDWAAIGFSQGGVFVNYLACKVPNLFPTIGLVGSGMQTNYKYNLKDGNAENVVIVNLRSDGLTFPFRESRNRKFIEEEILHFILPKSRFEKISDLAAINNLKLDPALQMSFYEKRLGQHSREKSTFNTPIESKKKDTLTLFKSTDAHAPRQLAVVDLPLALHSYPEKDPSGVRTNAQAKYTEFETDQQIVNLWMRYLKTLKQIR
jgi:hypothetical protein